MMMTITLVAPVALAGLLVARLALRPRRYSASALGQPRPSQPPLPPRVPANMTAPMSDDAPRAAKNPAGAAATPALSPTEAIVRAAFGPGLCSPKADD